MREASLTAVPAHVASAQDRFPWSGLLALAAAGFITILTEAMPAGLLPHISADLGVSESSAGQLVTLYAIGSLLAAIPLTAATRAWRRRPLLLLAIAGFSIVNLVTAWSSSYPLTLAARFAAGVFAGLLWALIAGHASRMVPASLQGKAIAVAMVGTPLALSVGIPAGTWLGNWVGWRVAFSIMSGLSVLLLAWVYLKVPDFPGQAAGAAMRIRKVLMLPGLRSVLWVTLLFVLAHNILYTYIAPWLDSLQTAPRVDTTLLVFGVASLAGIWGAGALVDRSLRTLVLASIAAFGVAAWLFASLGHLPIDLPSALLAGVVVWGVAFGGSATLFQTASARTASAAGSADLAQSMIVTAWNLGIAGGGLVGALLLQTWGAHTFAWTVMLLMALSFLLTFRARSHGFG
jgi:predicted MFS family arabinose efflux permease